MAGRKIRIGVVGLGRIGWAEHCPKIARHPAFQLCAVQDILKDRRLEAEEKYGVPSFSTLTAMLDAARLDAVTIAAPTHLHSAMAQGALRSGCHVLLEKPMAVDSRQAAAIVRAAKRYERVVTVYQSRRAAAFFQHLRRLISSGVIGQLYHVRIGAFNYVRRDDWQSLRRFGGGMLNNSGSHCLDQLLQLIGYDIKRVFADLRVVASLGDAEDVVKIVVETRGGVIGEIDINQASTIKPYALDVWGTQGSISYDSSRRRFTVSSLRKGDLPPKTLDASLASRDRRYPNDDTPLRQHVVAVDPSLAVDIYRHFALAIRKGKAPFVRPEEPLAVMRLIDRCRASSGRVQVSKL